MENHTAFRSSKNTSIIGAIFLTFFTAGIYLTFRWTENLNYLKRSDNYNPWVLSSIVAGSLLLEFIETFFTTGSWFLNLLSLFLGNGILLFLIVQIKNIGDQQDPADTIRKNVFGWLVMAFVINTLYGLVTIGHYDCKCFLCSTSIWFYSIIGIAEYCLLAWLFNQALDHEKINSGERINEGKTNGPWICGIICFIAAFMLGLCALGMGESEMTVAEYRDAMELAINKDLSTPGHNLHQYVENAHVTVKVYSAYVSNFQVTTKDGSNSAGVDGSNIWRIYLEITTCWDGVIDKNGSTVIGFEIENINGEHQVTKAGIVHTDAMVNTEDPNFWFKVGATLAYLLF